MKTPDRSCSSIRKWVLPSIALGVLTLAVGPASAATVLTSNGDTYIRNS